MKKILTAFLIYLLTATSGYATTWYAQNGSGNMSTRTWNDQAGGGGSNLTWAERLASDVFEANGQTGIEIDTDPGVGGEKVTLRCNSGGAFAVTQAVTITVSADLGSTTNASDCVTIGSGATAMTVTITGNIQAGNTGSADTLLITGSGPTVTIGSVGTPVTITGGSTTTTAYAVKDDSTVTTKTVYAAITGGSATSAHAYRIDGDTGTTNITGNINGGSGANYGLYVTGNATVNVTGNATGASSSGWYPGIVKTGTGTLTLTGDCIAHSTGVSPGCYTTQTTFIVTGNIVGTTRSNGAWGRIYWQPSSNQKYIKVTSDGTNFHYLSSGIGSDSGGTAISGADTASYISTDGYFTRKDTGSYTQGTATIGGGTGGGAWLF